VIDGQSGRGQDRGQSARRAIVEAKQRLQRSVNEWVTKIHPSFKEG
jgi:hypothetical protein